MGTTMIQIQPRLSRDLEMIRRSPCPSWLILPQRTHKYAPSQRLSALMHEPNYSIPSSMRGWSATAGEVDNFVFEDANGVFIEDAEMQQRLLDTNPNAFRDMVTTFLEANGRGYWDTSEENIERLQELYAEVEDRIEGV